MKATAFEARIAELQAESAAATTPEAFAKAEATLSKVLGKYHQAYPGRPLTLLEPSITQVVVPIKRGVGRPRKDMLYLPSEPKKPKRKPKRAARRIAA